MSYKFDISKEFYGKPSSEVESTKPPFSSPRIMGEVKRSNMAKRNILSLHWRDWFQHQVPRKLL